jgi:hypothetical protein
MKAGTQFIGVKPGINMAERKSNVANNPTDVYTIEEIAAVSRPYKVYTALLTQIGSTDPDTLYGGSGSYLDNGRSYYISSNPDNYDLSIYGDTDSSEGSWFISNYDIELGYNDSLVLNVNYAAPVVKILENTIGNVWFTYDDPGSYVVYGDFTDKTTFVISNIGNVPSDSISIRASVDTSNIYISTCSLVFTGTSAYVDNILKNTPIEIRIYE